MTGKDISMFIYYLNKLTSNTFNIYTKNILYNYRNLHYSAAYTRQ